MAGEIVGSVYVNVRAITDRLAKDIQDGVDKGAADADMDRAGKRLGGGLGETIADEAGDALEKSLPDSMDRAFTRSFRRTRRSVGRETNLLTRTINRGLTQGLARTERSFEPIRRGLAGSLGDVRGLAATLRRSITDASMRAMPNVTRIGTTIGSRLELGMHRAMRGVTQRLLAPIGRQVGRALDISKPIGRALSNSFSQGARAASRSAQRAGDMLGNTFLRATSRVTRTLPAAFRELYTAADPRKFGIERHLARAFIQAERTLGRLRRSLAGVMFNIRTVMMSVVIPLIANGLVLIMQYATALVGQLGFVVTAAGGATLALSAMFGSVLLGFIPLMFAFKGASKELEHFKNRAKVFGKVWEKDVGEPVQKVLLPYLNRTLEKTLELTPAFRRLGIAAGRALGEMAEGLTDYVTQGEGAERFNRIMEGSADIFATLGRAFQRFGEMMVTVWAAATPIARQLADEIEKLFTRWSMIASYKDDAGIFAWNFQVWYDRAHLVVGALGDIVVGLWNIFNLGGGESAPFMDTFSTWAEDFRARTESLAGQNKIREYFANAVPAVQELNGLIADLFRWLFAASGEEQSGIVTTLQWLRNTALPFIKDQFIPAVMELQAPIERLAVAFGDFLIKLHEMGTLEKTIDLLALMFTTLTALLEVPGFAELVSSVIILSVAAKVLGTALFPLKLLIENVLRPGVFLGRIFAYIGSSIAWVAGIIAAFGKVFLGAFGIVLGGSVGATIAAFAVGLAVLAAVVGLVWLAFKNWDTIVDFVVPIWDAIYSAVSSALGSIVSAVTTAWDAVYGAVSTVVSTLQDLWNGFTSFLESTGVFQQFISWFDQIRGHIQDIAPVAKEAWDTIVGIFSQAVEDIGVVVSFLSDLFSPFIRVIGNLFGVVSRNMDDIVNVFMWFFDIVRGIVEFGLDIVVERFLAFGEGIFRHIQIVFGMIVEIVTAAIDIIAGIFKLVFALISGDWGAAWDAVTGIVRGAWDAIFGIIRGAINIVRNIFTTIFNIFTAPFVAIYDFLVGNSIIPDLFDRMVEIITGGLAAFVGFFTALPGRIVSALATLLPQIGGVFLTLVSSVAGFVWDGLTTLIGFYTSLPGRILGALGTLVTTIGPIFLDLAGTILGYVWDGITAVVEFFISLPGRIVSALSTLVTTVGPLFLNLLSAVPGYLWQGFTFIISFFAALPGAIVGVLGSLITTVGPVFLAFISEIPGYLWEGLTAILEFFTGLPGKIVGALSSLATTVGPLFLNLLTAVPGYLLSGLTAVLGFFTSLPGKIVSALSSLGGTIGRMFTNLGPELLRRVELGFPVVLGFFTSLPGKIVNALVNLISTVGKVFTDLGGALLTLLQNGAVALFGFFTELPGKIVAALGALASMVGGVFQSAWNGWVFIVNTAWDKVKALISTAVETVVGFVTGIPGRIANTFATLWDGLTTGIQIAKDFVKARIEDVVGFVTGIPGKISDTISGLWDGIIDGISLAKQWVSDRIDDVVGFVTGLPGKIEDGFSTLVDKITSPFKAAFNWIAEKWNDSVGSLSFTVPSWVPGGIGGKGWSMPKMPIIEFMDPFKDATLGATMAHSFAPMFAQSVTGLGTSVSEGIGARQFALSPVNPWSGGLFIPDRYADDTVTRSGSTSPTISVGNVVIQSTDSSPRQHAIDFIRNIKTRVYLEQQGWN